MKPLPLKGFKKANNSTDIFEYDLNSSRGSRSLAIVNLNTSFESAGLSPRCYAQSGKVIIPDELSPVRTSIHSHNFSNISPTNSLNPSTSLNNSFVSEQATSPKEFNNNSGTYYNGSKRCVSIPTTPIVPLPSTPISEDDSFDGDDFLASTTPCRTQSVASSVGGRRFTPKKVVRKPLDIKPKEHIQLFSPSTKSVDITKRRNSVSGISSGTSKNSLTIHNTLNQSKDNLKHQYTESPRTNSARGCSLRVQSADPSKARGPPTPTTSYKPIRPTSSSSTSSTIVGSTHSSSSSVLMTSGWKPNSSSSSLPTPRMTSGRFSRKKSFFLNPSLKCQLEAIKSVPLFLTNDINPSQKCPKDNVSPILLNQVIESLFIKEDKLIEKAKLYNEFKDGEERIDRHCRSSSSTPRGSSYCGFNRNAFYPGSFKGASLTSARVEKENLMMENPFYLRKSQAGVHMDHFGVRAPISSRSLSSSRASVRR